MTRGDKGDELEAAYLSAKQTDPDCEPNLGIVQFSRVAAWMSRYTGKPLSECEAYLRAHSVVDAELGLSVINVDIGGTWEPLKPQT